MGVAFLVSETNIAIVLFGIRVLVATQAFTVTNASLELAPIGVSRHHIVGSLGHFEESQ